MTIEHTKKLMATTEVENKRDVDYDSENGEIIDERGDYIVDNPVKSIDTFHPLENSWTFWFDNPSAKSKHAAWGSSIRQIYTFSTVEHFWRSFSLPFLLFCC